MKYNKLVRDKIPEMLDGKNIPYEKRIADFKEYKIELIKKLAEEANEFNADGSVEELADVLEVIEALRKLPEYMDVEKVRQEKFEDRGGFEKRIILKGEK
ncbi:MAG: nucleoside triphosphate pyrophosphohydrolase [Candidatus Nomurabacteria bacterium]|nr:nucleoside triphosphate pyrophosphohydrolase [Candidatus Nomurabacteria bacterium]